MLKTITLTTTRFLLQALLTVLITSLSGCSDKAPADKNTTLPAVESYIETGDLPALKQHGQLRILIRPIDERWLPRSGSSFTAEQELAQKLAQQLQLEPLFVHVNSIDELIPALNDGRGDIIAANLTITESRKQRVAFSVPVEHSIERLVSRIDDNISSLKNLNNRTVAYQPETSYEETIAKLKSTHPNLKTQIIAGYLSEDQVLDQLASNQIDLTIMDSNTLGVLAGYRDDFKVSLPLTAERALAWAIRKDNPKLQNVINQFLTHEHLSKKHQTQFIDDLDAIKKRQTLRVITRNNAASYFLWRGELLGFEYEMVKAFAKQHKLRLEMVTAPDHESQIPMLLEGRGDIIASFMTITDQRKDKGVVFSHPHHTASEVVVSRIDDQTLKSVDDLRGRSLHVRQSSAYWETLQALQNTGLNFKLIATPESMETEEIIERVASGEYDLTLADNHILDIELTLRDDIRAAFPLGNIRENAWVMRNNNPQLTNAVNQFVKKQHRSLFYNVTYEKYFKNSRRIKKYRAQRIDLNPDGTLSPYDDLVKKYAQQFDFNWRLIISQMYQESRFNPNAKSWVGAQGLMQVMPRTAQELGIKNLKDPESGIRAGVKYMHWVRNRFETELSVKDRMWFTLAAYNAGQGHVKDARRLARKLGLNPDRWFDNVEKAMLLLSKRKYASKARHGYVRGIEPVNYVREIRNRYHAYIKFAMNGEN